MLDLSIIVPIFGVEKYIERCARSLFGQTLVDIEFIFVNDGTQDSSIDILKSVLAEFPHRGDFVHIISHNKNMGLPAARKSGLSVSTGKYILHCDSDDWLEPNCCEVLYNAATKANADVVVFKNWIDCGESIIEDNNYNDFLLANKKKALSSAISLKSSPYVWNKLVSRELYGNPLVFPKNNLAEDWVLSVQFAYYSKMTVCIEDRLYHYCRNENSIMGKATVDACFKRCADEFANVSIISNWLEEKGMANKFKNEMLKRKLVAKNQLLPIINESKARKLWRNTFSEINFPVFFCPDFNFIYKIRHFLLITGLYMPVKKIFR